jgi:eukaryotic-like serine/threonine-protein kinase
VLPEPDAGPATPPPAASHTATVQQAVEQFVELQASGRGEDPDAFAARFPTELRARIAARCREFLAFDDLLGHQEWAEPKPAESKGRSFGDFVIQEELGRGGMGVVYLAYQPSLQRRVALKVMQSGLTLSKRHVERFRREAAAAAQLRHPSIVSVHALVEVDGTFALAMDYVAGRNLADILDDLRLANGDGATSVEGTLGLSPEKGYVAECAMFVAQLASALAVAHQHQVVHRDLKPRNLMIDDRRQVRLLDFGLAKSLGEGSISMSGEITGTAHYMSPEQTLAKRVEVDHRADIWALGVILYELLTLRRPFDGKNLQQIVYELCFKEPVPIHQRNHKVPRDLVTICQKALEKDPGNRYATAADLEQDLLRFLRWEPIHARPASTWSRLAKWTRRHRTETALAGLALAAGLFGLGYGWVQGREADALLTQAAAAEERGQFAEAYALANQALARRNDASTRERLKRYAEADRRIEAEAKEMALRSRAAITRDREQAIQLAVAAERLHSSLETRSAVLDALGRGSVTRSLRMAGGAPATAMVGTAWSPDGRTVATVGFAGHVQLWDPATGAPRATLRGHTGNGPVIGAVFAGGDRLLTAGTDATLRAWRLGDGALLQSHDLPDTAAALQGSRDGSRVLVLTYRGQQGPFTARVHDAATLQPVSPPMLHDDLFVKSALSPCGRYAVTCTATPTPRLWLVDDGRPIATAPPPRPGLVRALAFSADSQRLAIATDHTVQVLHTASGRELARVQHSLDVTAIAFDGTGQRLLTGSRDWTARLWQLEPAAGELLHATEVATLTGHQGPVEHVAFDPSDRLALTGTGGQAGELLLFDLAASSDGSSPAAGVHRYEVGSSIESIAFSPDGRAVLARAGQSRVLVWDLGTGGGIVTMRQAAGPGAATFGDGEAVLTAGSDERLRRWSAADGSLVWASPPLGKPQTAVDVDAPRDRLVAGSRQDGRLHVRRLGDGASITEREGHGQGVAALRWHACGTRLLSAGKAPGSGGLAIVWNTTDWSRCAELPTALPIVAADARTDGSLIALVEQEQNHVQLWDPSAPAAGPRLPGGGTRPTTVRFAPDGQSLLLADRDGNARQLDLQGQVLRTFAGDRPLKFAVFSPDASQVLTGSDGRAAEAMLWRTADGSALLRFGGHRGVEWGAFRGDGASVVTTGRCGTVCVWPTDPAAVARRLLPQSPPPPPAPPAAH